MVGRKINQGGYPVPGLPGPEGPPGPPGPPGSIGNGGIISKLNFNISQYQLFANGELGWDPTKQALTYGLANGAGKLNIGQAEIAYVSNLSGVSIQRGQMVESVGTNGADISVALAPVTLSGGWNTDRVIGMALENISHTGSGYILVRGLIENIDTSMFLPAARLYHDAHTPGAITDESVTSAASFSVIGTVIRSHATLGAIYVDQRTSVTAAQLVGFRNKLINGSMLVKQYPGIDAVLNTPTYCIDRFIINPQGFTTLTTGTVSSGYDRRFPGYSCADILLSATGTGILDFGTRIDAAEASRLSGQTITISALTVQTSGVALVPQILLFKANFFADNFASVTQIGTTHSGVPVITDGAAATSISTSFDLSSTDADRGLYVVFRYPEIPAVSNKYFKWGGMQLEVGAVATQFELRPYSVELTMCQFYYEQLGLTASTTSRPYVDRYPYQVAKRVEPTISLISGPANGFTLGPDTKGEQAARCLTPATVYSPLIYGISAEV